MRWRRQGGHEKLSSARSDYVGHRWAWVCVGEPELGKMGKGDPQIRPTPRRIENTCVFPGGCTVLLSVHRRLWLKRDQDQRLPFWVVGQRRGRMPCSRDPALPKRPGQVV
jgi:hypothetical protein